MLASDLLPLIDVRKVMYAGTCSSFFFFFFDTFDSSSVRCRSRGWLSGDSSRSPQTLAREPATVRTSSPERLGLEAGPRKDWHFVLN